MIKLRIINCQICWDEKKNPLKITLYFNYIKAFITIKLLKGFMPQYFPASIRKWNNWYKPWKKIKLTLWLLMVWGFLCGWWKHSSVYFKWVNCRYVNYILIMLLKIFPPLINSLTINMVIGMLYGLHITKWQIFRIGNKIKTTENNLTFAFC